MSFHRATLVALATLFTVGMTSLASAGCCDWGYSAPANYGCGGCGAPVYTPSYTTYQPVAPVSYGGCGGCGAPVYSGCGGCATPSVAAVYAVPVAPAPIVVSAWAGTGCGCQNSLSFGGPSPLYVVNQGPDFSGPGLMRPYGTYAPETAYAPAANYPYVPGYGNSGYGPGYGYGSPAYHPYYAHRYYGPRYAAYRAPMYGHPMYGRPRYFGPTPGYYHGWHRPY
jgi:hypothetical protein